MLNSSNSKKQDLKKSLDLVKMEKRLTEEENQRLENEIKERLSGKSLSSSTKNQFDELNPKSHETKK